VHEEHEASVAQLHGGAGEHYTGVYCQEVVFRADIQRGKGSAVLELPFCGIENSGYGRKLSGFGIQEFIHKNVRVVAEPRAGTTL
jgi:hypothetical protein